MPLWNRPAVGLAIAALLAVGVGRCSSKVVVARKERPARGQNLTAASLAKRHRMKAGFALMQGQDDDYGKIADVFRIIPSSTCTIGKNNCDAERGAVDCVAAEDGKTRCKCAPHALAYGSKCRRLKDFLDVKDSKSAPTVPQDMAKRLDRFRVIPGSTCTVQDDGSNNCNLYRQAVDCIRAEDGKYRCKCGKDALAYGDSCRRLDGSQGGGGHRGHHLSVAAVCTSAWLLSLAGLEL